MVQLSVYEKILVVDSSTRDTDVYPYSNEYSISIGRTTGICGVDILDANIPLTQDPISERNNVFSYAVGSGPVKTATLPPGIYSETGLVEQLQSRVSGDGLQLEIVRHKVKITHPSEEFTVYLNRPRSVHPCLGIKSTTPSVHSQSREYTTGGMIDPTGGARYIRIRSNLSIPEHVSDVCDPGMGLYFTTPYPLYYGSQDRQTPWVKYPTRFFDRPIQVNSIGIRLENPDGSLYETGNMDHVFVVRLWKTQAISSSQQISEYQSK